MAFNITQAQVSRIIEYSYPEKRFTNLEILKDSIKPGEFFRIKVIGLNPNRITIKERIAASIKTSKELPNFIVSTLTGMAGSITPLSLLTKPLTENITVTTDAQTNLVGPQGPENAFEVWAAEDSKLVTHTVASYSDLNLNSTEYCQNLAFLTQAVLRKDLNKFLENEILFENSISEIIRSIQRKLSFADAYNTAEFKTDIDSLLAIRANLYDEKERIDKSFITQEKYQACLFELKDTSLKKRIDANEVKIETKVKAIHIEIDKMLAVISDSLLHKMRELHQTNFKTIERYYELPPRRYDSGLDTLTLAFYQKADNSLIYKQQLPLPVRIKKNRTRFSAQVFLSNLGSEAYTVFTDSEGNTNMILENKGNLEFGAASGINYLLGKEELIGFFGIGVGASYSDKVRPRLLLNSGLVLGEDDRFNISIGFILGYRDEKSEAFNNSNFKLMPSSAVVVSKLDYALNFSIGYFL